ncbi:glutathione S-transferase family protein [Maritalea mobilis]|uniref:glutathione S-transferase family protein n=1 Tax=Maritalea mobilis TaxID=483324 RepID=UPI001C963848|nr:glutathione S-transferase family protein [Maritalea mobilis]MBY6200880.1 glutathione S-transferase family protein [Maritalea mobilis]
MSDLTLYTHPMSRGRIARWMMEEAALPYEVKVVRYGDEMKSREYRAINPMGKVPTLIDRGMVITEVAAICAHMADLAPQAGLAPPPGTPERGAYYRWLFFGAGAVDPAVSVASLEVETDDPQIYRRVGWGSLTAVAATLEHLLEDGRKHILGEAFSAVDVYLGSQIAWGLQFGTLPERPGFADYVARITDRPAAKRAVELDDALLDEVE